MSFTRFLLKSIGLSYNVLLRMAAVSIVVAYAFYLGFSYLFSLPVPEENLVLLAVVLAIVLFLPTVLFLYLSALRSGLVGLGASGPSDLGTLSKALLRMMRFNFMMLNLFITLFGFGVSVVYLAFFEPQFIEFIRGGIQITSRAALYSTLETLRSVPLITAAFFTFGICLANGATGVSMAATATQASVRAPSHDMMWGLGSRFGPLFTVSAIFLLLPVLAGIYLLGGLDAVYRDLAAVPLLYTFGAALYFLWVGCFFAAAKSVAYVLTAHEIEAEHEEMMTAMSGVALHEEAPDLRSMLNQRLKAARTVPKSKSRLHELINDAETSSDGDTEAEVVELSSRKDGQARPRPVEVTGHDEGQQEPASVVPFRQPGNITDDVASAAPGKSLHDTTTDKITGESSANDAPEDPDWLQKFLPGESKDKPSSG